MENKDCNHDIREVKKEEDYEFIIYNICIQCGKIISTRIITKK